jgi:hypothetical protein
MIHWKRQAFAMTVAGIAALTLVGCTSGNSTPSATTTKTVTTTTSASPVSSPSAATPSPSSTDARGGDTSGSVSGLCTVAQLKGGVAAGSGGAAGSTYIHLTFTNTSAKSCRLQGWPGVSFVGDGNGTQIGAAATFDRTAPHPTLTLAPHAVAVAPLKITRATNYDNATCSPLAADGFRVYPPGSKASLYIKAPGYTACKATSVDLLNVQALVLQGDATD